MSLCRHQSTDHLHSDRVVDGDRGSGYIAVRILGSRYGYAISAIASGFASSTVTIATMGQRVISEPVNVKILSAAAVLSNLATITQIGLILVAVAPALLQSMWTPLLCGFINTAL